MGAARAARPWLALAALLAVAGIVGFSIGRSYARPVFHACVVKTAHAYLYVEGCTVVK